MRNTLKIERAILNLTQKELAEKVGVSRQSIYLIEKSKVVPSAILALKLSAIFQKEVNGLFELDERD